MSPPLVLSSSALAEWAKCSYRYMLRSVYRISGAPSVAQALGTSVHAAADDLLHGKPLETAQETRRAAFAREVALIPTPDEDVAVAASDGARMVETYAREVAPRITPTRIEEPFAITIDGVMVTGVFDVTTEDEVRDTKTAPGKTITMADGRVRRPHFEPDSYTTQLSLYGLAFLALTGRKPRRLLLDVLKRTGKYQEVEIAPHYEEVGDVVAIAAAAILRGEYEPNGRLSNQCWYCPFQSICKFSLTRDT